jgi:hypothetical protein
LGIIALHTRAIARDAPLGDPSKPTAILRAARMPQQNLNARSRRRYAVSAVRID